jgi:hypothetical protein
VSRPTVEPDDDVVAVVEDDAFGVEEASLQQVGGRHRGSRAGEPAGECRADGVGQDGEQ